MKYLSLFFTITALFATDIHAPSRIEYFTPVANVNPDFIGFSNGYAVDTRIGEPDLPANLRIKGCENAGYYLLQVKGPVYSDWLADLKALGIDVIVYIPNYAFIVYADPRQIDRARAQDFVKWTGIYQPAYKLEKELLNARGTARISIQLFPRGSIEAVRRAIENQGYRVVLAIDNDLCKTIDAVADLGNLSTLARIPDVQWIQRWSEPAFCNANAQWVTQTGYQSSTPVDSVGRRVWFNGVLGQGTVLSTSDSGIHTDHYAFYDLAHPITGPGVYPNHRKIVGYKVYAGATFGDVSAAYWHGTHTAGSAAGNDTTLGTNANDGMAKDAREYFCDIGDASGGLVVSTNLTPMYDTIYLGRGLPYHIFQHSGSWGWGNTSGNYLLQDASTDAYAYKYPDFLNLFAAGSAGPATRCISDPGIAKNVLTIGACGNGTSSNILASFSSRGPTADNRIKPNLCAPGIGIVSAQGGTTNGYWPMDGTSMAVPCANGAIGLIRQYLRAGYYPTGAANPPDTIQYISAALLRAMAMVSADPNVGAYVPPSFNIGWGRIDDDSVLYFAGDSRRLIIKDDTIGVMTGQSKTDSFNVNSAIPLRVCAAWADTAAAAYASRTLVNDINVQLVSPSGAYYRGNLYTDGQSTANPTTWDTINVEECLRVNAPEAGRWRLTITGQNVPNGPMGFAYAVTGDVFPINGVEEGKYSSLLEALTLAPLRPNPFRGNLVIAYNLPRTTKVALSLYDVSGRLAVKLVDAREKAGLKTVAWNGRTDAGHAVASGVYFLRLETEYGVRVQKIVHAR